jgi:hypothetical protein
MSNTKNRSGLWPRMAALAVMAGIVLLTAACGSSPSSSDGSPSAGGTPNAQKLVAFADCLRAHGMTVTVNGNSISSSSNHNGSGPPPSAGPQEGPDSPAMIACRHLMPNGGQLTQAQQAQNLKQALKYTQCIRTHGVPNMPDPSSDSIFNLSGTGIDQQSSQFQKAQQACQSVQPRQFGMVDNTKNGSSGTGSGS